MSYPRNAASPLTILLGEIRNQTDGAIQTSGVSVVVRPEGGSETAGAGTLAKGTVTDIWYYTPTQAETNHTSFHVVAYKTGCNHASTQVVTSAQATAGLVQVGGYVSGQAPLQPLVAGRQIAVSATTGKVTAEAAALDSATATQIDNIEATLTTLGSESTTVERSVSDTNAITFSWPVSGATITGTASLNNGAYGAVAGAIAFLRTETGRHYYTLAYNAADRPSAEGQVRYKFVDGTYTGYVVLRTVNLVTVAQVNAQVLDVLSVDTFGELTAPPAATSSLKDKLVWLFMWARNKATATATQRKLYADDGTTVASTETITDDGTTFTKGESL